VIAAARQGEDPLSLGILREKSPIRFHERRAVTDQVGDLPSDAICLSTDQTLNSTPRAHLIDYSDEYQRGQSEQREEEQQASAQ
jgi:hypothetical protein